MNMDELVERPVRIVEVNHPQEEPKSYLGGFWTNIKQDMSCAISCFGKIIVCVTHNSSSSGKAYVSGSVSVEKKNQDNDASPTYEIVFGWSQSFENLMKNRSGQKYFAEFLKGEYSDENILFWQACEELKREKNAEKIEEKARIIYEDFISILSPKEVSLDSRVREIVNTNMGRPSASTFDEAQNQIYTLMQRDSYPRFLASPIYKAAMQTFGVKEETV